MNHILLSRALLLTGSCLLLATTWCHGQAWRYQMLTQDTSYAAICTMADDYFQTHTEHQANNDHGYKDYWRFRWFWRDRYDDQKGYLRLGERHTEAIHLNEYCTANSQLESDWVSIGPNQIPQATGAMIANSATSCGLSVAGQSALSQGMLESVLAMDSTGQVIFAGSNSGGLFKTTNGGTTWANVTEAQKFPGMGIHRIIRDPNNAQRLWIATGNTSFYGTYGLGILKTENGGQTWSPTGFAFNPSELTANKQRQTYDLVADPNRPLYQYAVTDEHFYWTSNGWDTYDSLQLNTQDPNTNVRYLEVVPENNVAGWNKILIGGNGFWRFDGVDNQGNPLLDTLTANLPMTPGRTFFRARADVVEDRMGVIYALWHDNDVLDRHFFLGKSHDLGASWSIIDSSAAFQQCYWKVMSSVPFEFEASPSDSTVFYIGGVRIAKYAAATGPAYIAWSNPNSQHWMHDDMRDMQVFALPNGEDRLFVANDGGLSRSDNSGDSWYYINGSGLNIAQFYGMDTWEPLDYIVGGIQDGGSLIWRNGQWVLAQRLFSDGGDAVFYQTPHQWITNSLAGIRFISNAGVTLSQNHGPYQPLPDSTAAFTRYYNKIKRHPNLLNTGYLAGDELYRYKNIGVNGQGWTRLSDVNETPAGVIRDFAIATSDTQVIYMAFENRKTNGDSALWRTTDGAQHTTNSWTDLTGNLNQPEAITSVEVHPHDPAQVFVGFSGWAADVKVFRSLDHGNSWSNISDGLPNFAVLDLEFYPPNLLFAATDVGVYVRDLNNGVWQCFSKGLPNVIVSEIQINHCNGKLRAATYGRGMWETEIPFEYHQLANQTTTWTNDTTISAIVDIVNGNTITIAPGVDVNFTRNAGIRVMPGCSLVVDGALLHNACGSNWRGITVMGTYWGPQWGSSSPHGYCLLKNNARIENAERAVAVGDPDDLFTGGGILQAFDTKFRNNQQGIRFGPYHYLHNGVPQHNVSIISNCEFTNDTDLRDPENFASFIDLNEVWRVTIAGNTFRNSSTSLFSSAEKRGYGIRSFDSNFELVPNCSSGSLNCPPANVVPNRFENLYAGFWHDGINPANTGQIDHCVFEDNMFGVVLNSTNFAEVTNNQFILDRPDAAIGLYLRYSSYFGVYNNDFQGHNDGSMGLYVYSAGHASNLIDRNTFHDLEVAATFQDVNDGPNDEDGLQFRCNTMDSTEYDVSVISRNPNLLARGDIGLFQGVCGEDEDPANNNFSNSCNPGNESHIYIDKVSSQKLNYSYFAGDAPICYSANFVNLNYCGPSPPLIANKCPSYDSLSKVEKRLRIIENEMKLDSIGGLIKLGDSQYLLDLIHNDSPEQELMELLRLSSPHLSDEVLTTVMWNKPTPLSDDSLLTLFGLQWKLSKTVDSNLSAFDSLLWETHQIWQLQNPVDFSPRELLEWEIASYREDRYLIEAALIRDLIHRDSAGLDSALHLLDTTNSILAKEVKLQWHWTVNNQGEALGLLDEFASTSENTLTDYRKLHKYVLGWSSDSLGYYMVKNDSNAMSFLQQLSSRQNTAGVEVGQAQSLLKQFGETAYQIDIQWPKDQPSERKQVRPVDEPIRNIITELKVWPNPSMGELWLQWPNGVKKGEVKIVDITGRMVYSTEIYRDRDFTQLQANYLNPGVYFISLKSDQGFHGKSTLVIIDPN